MADISIVQDNCFEESDEADANKQTSSGFRPQSRWRSKQMEHHISAGVYEQGDGHSVGDSGDEALTPAQRVQKYAFSDNVYDRQTVSRVLLELFKLAPADALTADLPLIMNIVVEMADEDETIVKTDIMEHIPNLAALAVSCSTRVPALVNVTSEYLLPMVVRNLGTTDNQMRKTAHTTLFALMEKHLVSKAQAEIQVCPTVLALSRKECIMYYHSGAVTLMSKMVPLLGKDVTERVFLDRFSELCSNEMFYVRKMCASHFGEFCAVVGKPAYERVLLPAYVKLCEDDIWGVRKACADVAMSVSCVCTPSTRKAILAPVFTKLLQDDCRWVRISAYQTLGPFISTFADPTITSLAYNNLGELVLVDADGSEFKVNCTTLLTGEVKNLFYLSLNDFNNIADVDDCYDDVDRKTKKMENGTLEIEEDKKEDPIAEAKLDLPVEDVGDHVFLDEVLIKEEKKSEIEIPQDSLLFEPSKFLKKLSDSIHEAINQSFGIVNENDLKDNNEEKALPSEEGKDEDNLDLYNSYNYWYVPPDMPLDPSIIDAGRSPENTLSNESASEQVVNSEPSVVIEAPPPLNETVDTNKTSTSEENPEVKPSEKVEEKEETEPEEKEPPQNIVPQLLIDYFISMTDPSVAQNTDDNIAYHCAYSLPAVALTLGSSNWHLLKGTVETLAANMQYKIRRTVASSLHELAFILGPDMASTSLTPIFNGFIKDLDEVRIGILKHLAHFLQLISPAKRSFYLPKLSYFLQNNQELNWRYRHELAEQLLLAVNLFPPAGASKYISNIAQRLLCDKVSAVRQVSLQLVVELLKHIGSEPGLTNQVLIRYAEKFAHSKKWKFRQTFVLLSAELLRSRVLPCEQFATEVMPHMLDLSWDPVANVRLVIAETIAKHMITNEYFADPENQLIDNLQTFLRRLQTDKDRDVRQAAQADVTATSTITTTNPTL